MNKFNSFFVLAKETHRRIFAIEFSKFFDFDKVPMIGQAFTDEIFRVFQNKNPKIKLETVNMNEVVDFMVRRTKKSD